jgi:hypothetical protein
MAKTARERLARLLGDLAPGGSFSAQLLAPAHLLRLEVTGVGPVSLPVRAPQAKQLIAVARALRGLVPPRRRLLSGGRVDGKARCLSGVAQALVVGHERGQ